MKFKKGDRVTIQFTGVFAAHTGTICHPGWFEPHESSPRYHILLDAPKAWLVTRLEPDIERDILWEIAK
jgi:hypothetical protein